MKTFLYIIGLLAFLFFFNSAAETQNNQTKKEKRQGLYEETVKLIKSKKFIFDANRAFPLGGTSMDLTTNDGFMEVTDTIANADLPFFGRAYFVDFNGRGGIVFSGEIENPELTLKPEKRRIFYSFEVRDRDKYRMYLDVNYSGDATLIINSNNRSSIRYQGHVSQIEEEEESKTDSLSMVVRSK